jgi:integrase
MDALTNKLIKETIERADAENKEIVLWDPKLPRFGVRIKPFGPKTFIIQYRDESGDSKRLTLEKVGVLTLYKARCAAQKKLAEVRVGEDPVRKRNELRAGPTVSEFFQDTFVPKHASKNWKPSTRRRHEYCFVHIEKAFGSKKLTSVTEEDVRKLHESLSDIPYTANIVLGLLQLMFKIAFKRKVLKLPINPALEIDRYREVQRECILSRDQMARFFAALKKLEQQGEISVYQAAAVRFLMAAGGRKGEILSLRWDRNVHLSERRLLIYEHKTDGSIGIKVVHLTDLGISVLRSVPRDPDNGYVFVGRGLGKHIVDVRKTLAKVCKESGLPPMRVHDLRHAFSSFAVSNGMTIEELQKVLGWKTLASAARYGKIHEEQAVTAVKNVGGKFMKVAAYEQRKPQPTPQQLARTLVKARPDMTSAQIGHAIATRLGVSRDIGRSAATKAVRQLDPHNPARWTRKPGVKVDDQLELRMRNLKEAGRTVSQIARVIGADVKTVSKYIGSSRAAT